MILVGSTRLFRPTVVYSVPLSTMKAKGPRTDFEWTSEKEPHSSRRDAILKKYPEVKKLFGCDPKFKWQVIGTVFAQIAMLFVVKDLSWPITMLIAYMFGGVINHSLMLSIHDIGHNLAFGHKHPKSNRYFGMFANLPIGIPFSVSFKRYHNDHHRFQAIEKYDPDLPTYMEARLFDTTLGKLIWLILQPFFYSLRPLFVNPKPPSKMEIINIIIQIAFDYIVWYFFGTKQLCYLILGSLMAMGLHPVAGHFIAEHYMFAKGFETYSYYGPLNFITFNVGYHNEHHDFPAIPSSRFPELKKIAGEFYDNLPQHNSWLKVLYDFVTDPSIGLYARIKRHKSGLKT